MKKIYVGNLSFSTTEPELEAAFAPFGAVSSVSVVTDRDTGRPRGFGFIEMDDDGQADAAIQGLNGKELGGRAIVVNEARPQERREGGGGGGRGGPRGGGGGGRGRGGPGGGRGRSSSSFSQSGSSGGSSQPSEPPPPPRQRPSGDDFASGL